MTHSIFSPSSMYRWMMCSGSVHLIPLLDQSYAEPSSFQEEGRKLHEEASFCIRNRQQSENPVVQAYVNEACLWLEKADYYWIEQQWKHNDVFQGTPDFVAIAGNVLVILDFKSGSGVPVSVKNNSQLLYYAALVADQLPKETLEKIDTIKLGLIQPKLSPEPQYVDITVPQLAWWIQNILMPAIKLAQTDKSFVPGTHCQFCPARTQCPALKGIVQGVASEQSLDLDPQYLVRVLKYAPAMRGLIKAAEAELTGMLKAGKEIPGVKLVETKFKDGSRKDVIAVLSEDRRPAVEWQQTEERIDNECSIQDDTTGNN